MPLKKLSPLALYNLYARRAVAALVAVIAMSVFLYGFFLLEAVSHAAAHAQARRDIAVLSSQIGKLQSQYLSAAKALTPERARSLGFVAPVHVAVVYADGDALSLSAR